MLIAYLWSANGSLPGVDLAHGGQDLTAIIEKISHGIDKKQLVEIAPDGGLSDTGVGPLDWYWLWERKDSGKWLDRWTATQPQLIPKGPN